MDEQVQDRTAGHEGPSGTDAPPTLRLDEQLCFALYAATNAITRSYRPLLERIGLTYPQYLVLMVLWEADGCAVGDIARRLQLPPHAVTPILGRLEKDGLLTRHRDLGDARVVRVHLTPSGRDLEFAAVQVRTEVVCATGMGALSSEELRVQLHALACRLAEAPPPAAEGLTDPDTDTDADTDTDTDTHADAASGATGANRPS